MVTGLNLSPLCPRPKSSISTKIFKKVIFERIGDHVTLTTNKNVVSVFCRKLSNEQKAALVANDVPGQVTESAPTQQRNHKKSQ